MWQLTLGRLRVTVEGDDRARRAILAGRLDEESRLADLAAQLTGARIEVDAAGVQFINSIGVREWIHFLQGLRRHGAQIALVRVSEPLTAQLSMLRAAREGTEILSVLVPYECTACMHEDTILVDVAAHRSELLKMQPPVTPCPRCQGRMELADLPERYFLFVRDAAAGA